MKRRHEDEQLNRYASMGMAAMLPGMQYAVELMQRNLDDMRAQLAAMQNGDGDRELAGMFAKPKRLTPEGAAAISAAQKARWAEDGRSAPLTRERVASYQRGYWASMTPEERAAEMKRRMAKRRAKLNGGASPNHPQNVNHPRHAEWLAKRKKYPSRAKVAKKRALPVVKLNGAANEATA